jgi:hypothetical protein
MSFSEHPIHQANVQQAETVRQAAIALALLNGTGATTRVGGTGLFLPGVGPAITAAEVTYNRACLASAIANGLSPVPYITVLKSLGTGGL